MTEFKTPKGRVVIDKDKDNTVIDINHHKTQAAHQQLHDMLKIAHDNLGGSEEYLRRASIHADSTGISDDRPDDIADRVYELRDDLGSLIDEIKGKLK